jgi:1-deoxyxylulose-5-phosphate synthase
MRYVRLAGTDLDVSVLGLGCGNFGGVGSAPELFGRGDDEATAFALMDAAREHGITLFDTANSYGGGRSEEWIGRWLASRGARDDVVLTTKVRNRVGPGPDDEGLSARHIREQIDASLRRLGTDRIDLYLAHEPDPRVPVEETLAAFDELVRAGNVRHYGLSNFAGAEVAEAAETATRIGVAGPVNLQSSYSLLDRAAAADAFDVCSRYGVAFTAFSPLAGGWLSGKYRAAGSYPAGSRMTLRPEPYEQWVNEATFRAIGALDGYAARRGVSLPALALAWVLGDPAVSAIVIGPRRPEQFAPALDALDVPLTAGERGAIVELFSGGGVET